MTGQIICFTGTGIIKEEKSRTVKKTMKIFLIWSPSGGCLAVDRKLQYIGRSLLGADFPAASSMLRDPAAIIPSSLEAWKN